MFRAATCNYGPIKAGINYKIQEVGFDSVRVCIDGFNYNIFKWVFE